jgi:hypothetical protein
MMMKIGADNLMNSEFLNINTSVNSFLTMNFGNKKFDVIIMNPPWVGDGIKFIEKARSLLKKGGKLVCIIGYNQFTDLKSNPGSFHNLVQNGFFERIEVFKGTSPRDYFNNNGQAVGDWCWFTWINDHKRVGSTAIVNRSGEEFFYDISPEDRTVPQMPEADKYFDWTNGLTQLYLTNKTRIVNEEGCCFRTTKTGTFSFWEIEKDTCAGEAGIFYSCNPSNISKKTLKYIIDRFHIRNRKKLYQLYATSRQSDVLRMPPLRRDLEIIFKREDIERMRKIIDKADQKLELPISDQRRNDLEKLKINLQLKINEYLGRIKREALRLNLTNYIDFETFKGYISFVENNDELTDEELQIILREYNGEGQR